MAARSDHSRALPEGSASTSSTLFPARAKMWASQTAEVVLPVPGLRLARARLRPVIKALCQHPRHTDASTRGIRPGRAACRRTVRSPLPWPAAAAISACRSAFPRLAQPASRHRSACRARQQPSALKRHRRAKRMQYYRIYGITADVGGVLADVHRPENGPRDVRSGAHAPARTPGEVTHSLGTAVEINYNHATAQPDLYRFRTRRRCCDLRFGRISRLRQDRGLGPFACST